MSCNVMSVPKFGEISYRVKCVAVESERVFGDVYVTEQNRKVLYRTEGYRFPFANKKSKNNLIEEILNEPDFLELNRKRPIRRASTIPIKTTRKPAKRSKSLGDAINFPVTQYETVKFNNNDQDIVKKPKVYPVPLRNPSAKDEVVTSLVDQLLLDIYGLPAGDRGRSESDSTVSSLRPRPQHQYLQKARLLLKSKNELDVLILNLREHINHTGSLLVRQLRRKDYLTIKRDKQYDIITAHLQAHSAKRVEDTRMRFSLSPQPGESSFIQWLDAMKMVARLQGGIPPEFRKRLWLTLAERHLEQRGVDWKQAEKVCFNEWSNPDDEELGIQIVKDLHRTGCSLFCGAAGRDNQAVLRRVLLGFARWNKSVGYCQGLNVLAALVLQVMDRAESAAVKVMIYLIEGVLPEGYFADNLRGLSVDMAVFRDLLRARLPKLSKHLEALQSEAKDKATGSSYEPPLTNVFTMQWFLTLFCHCLPQEAVLRVWDLIFLEGNEVLLRAALAIWEGLSDRIMTVTSADEFYSIMGVLTREMLEFTDTNSLIKNIVSMGPLHGVTNLREKHRYNITPWARKLSDDDDSDTEEDERLAVAAAMFSVAQRLKKDRLPSTIGALQAMAPNSDRERLVLDISTLKQQYAKLRERQRQAHIILSAACARQSMVPTPTSQAMNHLLVGKSALVSSKNRPLTLTSGPPKGKPPAMHSPRSQNRKDRQGVTLHWKDTKRTKQKSMESIDVAESSSTSVQSPEEITDDLKSPKRSNADSDSDSTSTELCDEPDRMSDVDSEDLTSASESCVMATEESKNPRIETSIVTETQKNDFLQEDEKDSTGTTNDSNGLKATSAKQCLDEISISKITDQIRRLSAEDDNNTMVPQVSSVLSEKPFIDVSVEKSSTKEDAFRFQSDDVTDYNNDENIIKKSLALDDYDYFSFDKNKVTVKEEEVLVHESFRTKDVKDEIEDVINDVDKAIKLDKHEVTVIDSKPEDHVTSNYSSVSPKKKYEMDLSPSTTDKENRFETSFNLYGNMAAGTKTLEDDEVDNSIKVDNFSKPSNAMFNDLKFSSRTYVVGHLPISPVTVDEKLTQMSKLTHGNTQDVNGTSGSNPEIKLDMISLNDRSPISQTKSYLESKKSPKTPESSKSFSSGETMGPDSKPSSLTVSPRTPVRSESRDFLTDKSCSSVSSDSKTLILRSVDSDIASSRTETKKTSYEKSSPSTPISTDSLRNKSETSPKLIISSSSDSCSPSKLKSSERSFSSDLQSPISANSIKYTSNYSKLARDNISGSPIDLCAATSPFYPISNPNQKTPSPYNINKQKYSLDSTETSPEQKSSSSKESNKYLGFQSKFESSYKMDAKDTEVIPRKSEYVRPSFSESKEDLNATLTGRTVNEDDYHIYKSTDKDYYRKNEDYMDDNLDDPLSEKDTVPSLPKEDLDKRYLNYNYRHRDRSKVLERSSSSLDRRYANLKSSASQDEIATSMAKKRSSDILEDMKHLEAKVMSDGSSDSGILTKKSSYIWEDLKNLEARRQDTFSNSARNFCKRRLEIPDINVTGEGRKSYIVHPRINIDDGSDSILKTMSRTKDYDENDDGRESKLGVWTKVKPRKKSDNGRRNSDRALKIIQENSAILHKILACQAKKRLPDLEEISKEITISPINEEISKIFSPILEKMGLDEHEINEELARINFKDFNNMTATSVSEFDAKINDELSKLSLIDDSETIDHFEVDDVMSHDYLDRREALIDRRINEELSKLLANYEDSSPASMLNLEKSSTQNISEMEGLDLTSISTNVFSYKSSNDSIDVRSELDLTQGHPITVDKYPQFSENVLPYKMSKYTDEDLSPNSDIDIYRELEKLDKISSAQVLPDPILEMPQKELSPLSYAPNASPYSLYSPKSGLYDTSPLKSSYDPYKAFDFKSKISPKKSSSNPYAAIGYEKPVQDTNFEYIDLKTGLSSNAYDLHLKSPILTKESLEFRVRYDDDSPRQCNDYLSSLTNSRTMINTNQGSSYYTNGGGKSTSYIPIEEKTLSAAGTSYLEYSGETSDLLYRKYEPVSPRKFSHSRETEFDRHLDTSPSTEAELRTYLSTRHRDYLPKSPSRQFPDQMFPSSINHYASKLSPGFGDENKRPVSHPEFPGKPVVGTYLEQPDRDESSYKKPSLSLGNIGQNPSKNVEDISSATSPKIQFSPFPVRNAPRKPKELTLKLGLYAPKSSDLGQLKKS